MEIKFFCPHWGAENLSWDDFCSNAKSSGYDGVETAVPFDQSEKKELITALEKHELLLIGQYFQSFESDFSVHKKAFEQNLRHITSLNPVLIDSQTGKDYYSLGQTAELLSLANSITRETGIPIAHETHRNKALFAVHVTREILIENPDTLIAADFSHWCNVSESLLEQQENAVNLAIERAIHIHARVGHAQSPQISDPRAPEWNSEVGTHLSWWDRIVQCRLAAGSKLLTITPEFGPEPYMPVIPYTQMPVANQWEINIFMMELLKKRYKIHISRI